LLGAALLGAAPLRPFSHTRSRARAPAQHAPIRVVARDEHERGNLAVDELGAHVVAEEPQHGLVVDERGARGRRRQQRRAAGRRRRGGAQAHGGREERGDLRDRSAFQSFRSQYFASVRSPRSFV